MRRGLRQRPHHFQRQRHITLGSTLPTVLNTLRIDGSGQTIAIDGAASNQILLLYSPAALTLNDLTIQNGSSTDGGGVQSGGTLTVTNSTLSGNTGLEGGGIFNYGTLTVTKSTFSGNSAPTGEGGGIFN